MSLGKRCKALYARLPPAANLRNLKLRIFMTLFQVVDPIMRSLRGSQLAPRHATIF